MNGLFNSSPSLAPTIDAESAQRVLLAGRVTTLEAGAAVEAGYAALDAMKVQTLPASAMLYTAGCFWDPDGALGIARALYVPLTFQLQRNGATVTKSDIGSAHGTFTSFTYIVIPTLTSIYHVHLDLSTGAANARLMVVTSAAALNALNVSDVIKVCTIRGSLIVDNRMNVRLVTQDGLPHPKAPIVVERDGKVHLPPFYSSNGAFAQSDAAPTSLFLSTVQLAIDAGSLGTPTWLVKNRLTGANEVFYQPTRPAEPIFGTILYRYQDMYGSPYPLVGPGIPGGCMPNQATTGKNNPELAGTIFASDSAAEVVNIADLDLTYAQAALDLGFTKGLRNNQAFPLVLSKMWYGGPVANARAGYWVLGRVMIYSTVDDNFGSPRLAMWTAEGGGIAGGNVILKLLKQHNARLATFAAWGRIPEGINPAILTVGTIPTLNDESGANYTLMGGAFGASPSRLWIAEDDFGGANLANDAATMVGRATGLMPFLLPPTLPLIGGRPLRLFPPSMFDRRDGHSDVLVRIDRMAPMDGSRPLAEESGTVIEIDPDRVGTLLRFSARAATRRNDGFRQAIDVTPIVTDPADLAGKSLALLSIADSTMATNGILHQAVRVLGTYGATITGIGTVNSDERTTNMPTPVSGQIVVGEQREGWRAADCGGEFGDPTSGRAPASSPSAYLALTNSQRKAKNPMLRQVTVGDTEWVKRHAWKAATVANTASLNYWDEVAAGHGPDPTEYWTFDIGYWQTAYSMATPDVVLINLGTNEMNDFGNGTNSLDPLGYIQRALESIVTSLRTTWPAVPVILVLPNISLTAYMQERWGLEDSDGDPVGQAATIRLFLKFVQDWIAANPDDADLISLVPMWAASDPSAMVYPTTTTADTDLYGYLLNTIEGVHSHPGPSREQPAELVAAALAAVIAGLP